jgi:hypothetical protein
MSEKLVFSIFVLISFILCSCCLLLTTFFSFAVISSSSQRQQQQQIPKYRCQRLISCLIFCHLAISSVSLFGYQPDHHILCKIQGFVISYFSLCAIFWSYLLTLILLKILYAIHWILNPFRPSIHLICWGIPFILTLLPLSMNSYGHQHNHDLCSLQDNNSSGSLTIWRWLSFYLLYWIYVFLTLFAYLAILYKLTLVSFLSSPHPLSMTIITRCLMRLLWFPLITISMAFPSAIYDTMLHSPDHHPHLRDVGNLMLVMGGTWTSLAYILTHPTLFQSFWELPLVLEISRNSTDGENPPGSSSDSNGNPPLPTDRQVSTIGDVDDEYMFLGLSSLTPEMRKRLSLRDLHLLEILRVSNGSLPSVISSQRSSRRYHDSSEIDVSVSYPDGGSFSSSRCSSDGREEKDLSDFFSGNRISLRLQLLKSAINAPSADDGRLPSPAPLSSSSLYPPDSLCPGHRQTLSSEAREAGLLLLADDRLSLSSLQTEEIFDTPRPSDAER